MLTNKECIKQDVNFIDDKITQMQKELCKEEHSNIYLLEKLNKIEMVTKSLKDNIMRV